MPQKYTDRRVFQVALDFPASVPEHSLKARFQTSRQIVNLVVTRM